MSSSRNALQPSCAARLGNRARIRVRQQEQRAVTRKDYILIAAALKRAQAQEARDGIPSYGYAARFLADALARDNARFEPRRFLDAAGVQS